MPRSQPVPMVKAYSVPAPAVIELIFAPLRVPDPIPVAFIKTPLLVKVLAAPEVKVFTSTPLQIQLPPEQAVTVGAETLIGFISFVPVVPDVLIIDETFSPLDSEFPEVFVDASVTLILAKFPV